MKEHHEKIEKQKKIEKEQHLSKTSHVSIFIIRFSFQSSLSISLAYARLHDDGKNSAGCGAGAGGSRGCLSCVLIRFEM